MAATTIIWMCVICLGIVVADIEDTEIISNEIETDLSPIVPTIQIRMHFQDMEAVRRRLDNLIRRIPFGAMEDAKLLVPDIINKYGYPSESHHVTTSDGYILTMHRIPYGRKRHSNNSPVIFLQHGLMSSSADWLLAGPDKSLGYILADEGYDVWLGNARGNRYSRNHTKPDITVEEFWKFSWHEIALYDVSAMIDYVLAKTQKEKLNYIGHSQGTTVFYVLCSEKPEFNDKIQVQISLAPVAYMENLICPIFRLASRYFEQFEAVSRMMRIHEFIPDSGSLFALTTNVLCNDNSLTQVLCVNVLFSLFGFNERQMNTTLIPLYLAHAPAGSSAKQFLHYSQEVVSGKFGHWNHGPEGNLQHYNATDPPDYNLGNIRVPVYLFYSKNDWASHELDVQRLCVDLKEACAGMILIDDPKFNHLDYLYAIDAPKLVYEKLLAVLEEFNQLN